MNMPVLPNLELPCPVVLPRAAVLIDPSLEVNTVYWAYEHRGDRLMVGLPSDPKHRIAIPIGLVTPLAEADIGALATVPVTNSGDHGPRQLPVLSPRGTSLNDLELPTPLRRQLEHVRTVLGDSGDLLDRARSLGSPLEPSRLFVLCGPSGVGKTSTVMAVCAELGLRLVRMGGLQTGSSYHTVAEQAMRDLLATAHHTRGRLAVLLDDGDALVRTRFASDSHRLLDNEIAALIQSIELYPRATVFVTTNAEPEEIDAAILSRSERVIFPPASPEQRLALARRMIRTDVLESADVLEGIGTAPLSLRDVAQLVSRMLLRVAARNDERPLIVRRDVEIELATFRGEYTERRAGFAVR